MKEVMRVINGQYNNHVMPFFWQRGEEKDKVYKYMLIMKKMNIHSCVIEARPFSDFCGPKWWELMDYIIDIAKEIDMKIWIFNDVHFPTGYANGIVKKNPQYGKKVLKHRIINICGPINGCGIHKELPQETTAQLLGLVGIYKNTIKQLHYDIEDEMIYLDVPEGNWDIELFYIGKETDYNSDYINMIDKEACLAFINEVYESHYQRYKGYFGNVIAGFFTDEPGFQNEKGIKNDSLIGKEMPLPWSYELEKELRKIFKGDFLSVLHYLWIRRNEKTDGYVKFHYMNSLTKLYQKNFDECVGDWCQKHGVRHIGHIIEDRDAHARLGGGSGHFFRAMSGQDMAGIDAVYNQLIPGFNEGHHTYPRGEWDNEFFHFALAKLGTSLAHIDPRKNQNTMAEVFGAYGWHEGIHMMKWIVDHFINRGVNYFVPHAFSMADFPDDDCPPHFYANENNPQHKYFSILMKYTNQMCTLFSNGRANPQVAILYHGEAEWSGDFMDCKKPAKILTQNQIQFDILPTDIWITPDKFNCQFNNGLVVNGYNYPYLIIPYCQYITKEIIKFLQKTNIEVIFINQLPKYLYDSKKEFNQNMVAHAKIMTLKELDQYIKTKQISLLKIDRQENDLRFYDYIKNQQHYYHLFNENPQKMIESNIEIQELEKYKYQYRINLLNNQISRFDKQLVLHPNESCIILGSNQFMETKDYSFSKEIEIKSDIYISFAKAKDYPIFSGRRKLESFVDINRYIYNGFSGTIRYVMNFNTVKDIKKARIELYQVFEIADVYIDDVLIATRITEPYYFETSFISKGQHQLTIDITNTLDKAIVDDFSKNEPVKPSGLLKKPIIKY